MEEDEERSRPTLTLFLTQLTRLLLHFRGTRAPHGGWLNSAGLGGVPVEEMAHGDGARDRLSSLSDHEEAVHRSLS